MEVPLSWPKTRGGLETEWIGYTVDLKNWTLGVSKRKVEWLNSWGKWAVSEGRMLGREFRAGLGRMGFLAGAIKVARPLLAPLYAAIARVPGGTYFELRMAVKLAITFFQEMVGKAPMKSLSAPPKVLGEIFRVDAMADQDGIAIGGWETRDTCITKQARWFHVKLTRRNAPFLYMKGEPFRTISTSELLAVTVAIMVFGPSASWREGAGRISVTGFTDNLSNAFLLDKFLTTRFPASLVLMELAAQLDLYSLDLSLSWIPREQNEDADDLSKERFGNFDPELRMEVDMEKLDFIILRKMVSAASSLDEEVKEKTTSKMTTSSSSKTPPSEKLRLTQPW